ncbi:MAG: hypothetical protein ACI89X_001325 [Planctomycetota bacterium]|jgi:hypothetical protein
MMRSTTLACFLLLTVPLAAQRDTPSFDLQKRSSTIAYGAVSLGKHSLDELSAGSTWRLGMNNASTWRTEMPVVIGDQVLAPGEYRIQLKRLDEARCGLEIHGSALALGDGEELRVDGPLKKVKKKAKKLRIDWRKGTATKGTTPRRKKLVETQAATIAIHYGNHQWTGDVQVLGGVDSKLGKYRLTVFAVPAKLIAARNKQPVPIAVITKGKSEAYQVVLEGDDAVVRPWMRAPTTRNGFGDVEAPSAALTTSGKVSSKTDPAAEKGGALLLVEAKLKKQDATIELLSGNVGLTVTFTVPKPLKK